MAINKAAKTGVIVFVLGILFNEGLLMTQGIVDINYKGIRFINNLLLMAALIMFAGIFIFNCGLKIAKNDLQNININK